jgi:L-threonylcarbamoyladenylate synthase
VNGPRLVPARQGQAIAEALAAGGVIAVPFDGGYRAAARADLPEAVAALASLAVSSNHEETPHFLVGHGSQAAGLVADWGLEVRRLTDRCWPGPLTMILDGPDGTGPFRLSMATTRHLRRIIHRGGPLRVADIRPPGESPLTTAAEVAAHCDPETVALVVDGGTRGGPGPTVVDCRLSPPRVLHLGALPAAYVDAALLMAARRRPTWFG